MTFEESFPLISAFAERILKQKATHLIHFISAFTHQSYTHENPQFLIPHQERLEFIGDSLVNLWVTKAIFECYPTMTEGEMSKLRSGLVGAAVFAALAEHMELGKFLLLGAGEIKNQGHKKTNILADTFEAVWAAVYFNNPIQAEILFWEAIQFDFLIQKMAMDYKSILQEWSMEKYALMPKYKAVKLSEECIAVELYLGDKCIANGQGPSRKIVERELAKKILIEEKKLCY